MPWVDRKGRERAGNKHVTVASRCKELATFAAWCDMDGELVREIQDRGRRHLREPRNPEAQGSVDAVA